MDYLYTKPCLQEGQKPGYSYCILSAPLTRSLQDKTNPHPTSQLYSIHCFAKFGLVVAHPSLSKRQSQPFVKASWRLPPTHWCLRRQRIRSWFRETSKPLQFPYLPRILINGSCWFKYPGVGASPWDSFKGRYHSATVTWSHETFYRDPDRCRTGRIGAHERKAFKRSMLAIRKKYLYDHSSHRW